MKTKFVYNTLPILILSLSINSSSQEYQNLSKIESRIDSLYTIKAKIDNFLQSINTKIKSLEEERTKILVANDTTKGILIKLSGDGYLKEEPATFTNIIMKLPKGIEVLVIGYTDSYFKSKVGEKVGYVHEMFFPANEDLARISGHSAMFSKLPVTNSSLSKTYNSSKPPGSSSSSRTIYTGPRGGKYYINSKGKKVYIKKK
jgi:hypothetical protein